MIVYPGIDQRLTVDYLGIKETCADPEEIGSMRLSPSPPIPTSPPPPKPQVAKGFRNTGMKNIENGKMSTFSVGPGHLLPPPLHENFWICAVGV